MPKGGGSVEGGQLNPRLRLMQDADMKGKVVLVRADHNVVKKGGIKDYYRIDVTFGTFYGIVEKGGRPIVMTHVGRPRDKNTAKIRFDEDTSVTPVVEYLQDVLSINIHVPKFSTDPDYGILHLEESIYEAIDQLKTGKINMIYLPNTRWFRGEESNGEEREEFAKELASLADIYVYDAFGSWRPHVSTYDIARLLPSYAGLLVQKELQNLHRLFQPDRPFLAVVAGAKYDTKLGPLKVLHDKVDHLILGGILYNAYLSAKYDIEIQGVDREQKELARSLVELDQKNGKIIEPQYLVESETLGPREEGRYKTVSLEELKAKGKCGYIVDIDPKSIESEELREVVGSAKTIFVNAVMGLLPQFPEGSRAFYELIDSTAKAKLSFAGGDTLQALKELAPGVYLHGFYSPDIYFFTGGGSVLAAIEMGDPYQMKPIQALMEEG